MIADRESFCQQPRQAREASGMTLEAIAEVSKIQTSLLAGLELRRSFQMAVGNLSPCVRSRIMRRPSRSLHPDEVVGDFVRLFPDDVAVPDVVVCDVTATTAPAQTG